MLDYLVKNGSQRVVQQCKDNMFSIETLKDFQYLDKEGKDQGSLSESHPDPLPPLYYYYYCFLVVSHSQGESKILVCPAQRRSEAE